MRHVFIPATAALLVGVLTSSAQAKNATIEDAVKSREDLSIFHGLLVDTGVLDEMDGGGYTVFAPTNEAFAKLPREKYPCFYAPVCKKDVASIIRNHIVRGEQHLSDIAKGNGGLHSIAGRFISIGQPYRDDFVVDGHEVLRTSGLFGSMLYKIDGVIASEQELFRHESRPPSDPARLEQPEPVDTPPPSQ